MLAEAEKPTPLNSTIKGVLAQDAETQTKFFAMEHVFWIKVRHFSHRKTLLSQRDSSSSRKHHEASADNLCSSSPTFKISSLDIHI